MDTIKLIASDMDHTLLTELGALPPHFDDRIAALDRAGIDFVIASGRPLYTLEHIFSKMKRRMSFISDNGGVVSYRGEIIAKNLLKPADYQQMIQFAEDRPDGIAVLCGLDSAYLSERYTSYGPYLSTFYTNITFVPDIKRLAIDANKFTVYFPHQDSEAHYEKTYKAHYDNDFSITVGGAIWIDIMNRGVDKGQAMRFLGEKLGLTPEHMMAFGDTYNDREMLQAVKHSYIVRNASEDMRQYARFIADTNDNFGVMKVIDKVIRGQYTAGDFE
jgi:Cof subfamily protein (haloacid dehalogenase superfamily)